jgi:hypothetical protein
MKINRRCSNERIWQRRRELRSRKPFTYQRRRKLGNKKAFRLRIYNGKIKCFKI